MDLRLSERDVPLPGFAFQRQRYFTDDQISEAIDSALDRVDPNKKTVILRGQVDKDGGGVVVAYRPNGVWTIGGIFNYEKGAGWGTGFEIKAEW